MRQQGEANLDEREGDGKEVTEESRENKAIPGIRVPKTALCSLPRVFGRDRGIALTARLQSFEARILVEETNFAGH